MKRLILSLALLTALAVRAQTLTLDEAQQAARQNYPAIRQQTLTAQMTTLGVADIQTGWLPQLSAMAQATLQSDVTQWPDAMQTMLGQLGIDVPGMRKDQYRIGIELNQRVWDGGRAREQKRITRLQGEVEQAETDVTLYQVADRVNRLYFGILLLDEQLQLNADWQALLAANLQRLEAMLRGGTAAQGDVSAMQAERLGAVQQATELEATKQVLRRMLALLCGVDTLPQLVKPEARSVVETTDNHRPELLLIDKQLQLADAEQRALNARLLPRLSVFAQGFYGYPGYNMFESMMRHDWTLNGMVGARLTWDIGALYTRRSDLARLNLKRSLYGVRRDVFLLNSAVTQASQQAGISKYRRLMEQDDQIIALRTQVRQTAESKLRNGIIDVNGLLQELTRENSAKTQRMVHELSMLQEIYNLKYTMNN